MIKTLATTLVLLSAAEEAEALVDYILKLK